MRLVDLLKLKGDMLYAIDPGETVAVAISQLVEKDIGSLIVMENGSMLGLLTFREALAAIDRNAGGMHTMLVSEIMIKEPIVASPEDTVDHMRSLMTSQHVRYLPIVENGDLVGVLSFHDLARAALNAADRENRVLKQYIKNWPKETE